jgi:dihydropteroate synthase
MGIVNVTPDSFSDGGRWYEAADAIAHGLRLVEDGAAILDVGGESTRPGAEPVEAREELRRAIPVVRALSDHGAAVSIDTTKLVVAEAAVEAGASYVNDVSAFRAEPEMASFVAERGVRCCLMHMLGEPRTMQDHPRYEDVVDEVKAFLHDRAGRAIAEGVAESQIDVDPGIGFGKTAEHNLALLNRLGEIADLGFPVMVGASRKTFIGRLDRESPPLDRVAGTTAANVLALERGASIFRVHDVAAARQALTVAAATLGADGR